VVAANPNDALALTNFGNVLNALHRREEALQSLDRALALAPGYPDGWCNRGNVLQDMGRLEEALASYDWALSLKPDFLLALNNRGNTLTKLRQYEAALGSYDYALMLNEKIYRGACPSCRYAATPVPIRRGLGRL